MSPDHRDEISGLRLQLRKAKEKQSEMFDQGFEAATRMFEAGATPSRLREATGIPCAITRAQTAPWDEDTDVDIEPIPGAM